MRKNLVCLAGLAVCSVASAQSSVTLFGIIDADYSSIKTNAGRISGVTSSGYRSSRLGFRGTEDLGGGLSAGFWLEGGFNPPTGAGSSGTSTNNQQGGVGAGALTFNRRSFVSLSGSFGEIRLGRDYVPSYWNYTYFDNLPFYGNGVGSGVMNWVFLSTVQARASNSINYYLPSNIGGVYGQLTYAFGNRPSNETFTGTTPTYAVGQNTSSNGRYAGAYLGYKNATFDTALGYGRATYAPGTYSGSALGVSVPTGNWSDLNWGASYTLNAFKFYGYVARQEASNAGALGNTLTAKGGLLGVAWTIGSGVLGVNASRATLSSGLMATDPRATKWSIGYVHNLSKRTAIYGAYAHVSNSGGAALGAGSYSPGSLAAVSGPANVNGSSTGLEVGVSHSF